MRSFLFPFFGRHWLRSGGLCFLMVLGTAGRAGGESVPLPVISPVPVEEGIDLRVTGDFLSQFYVQRSFDLRNWQTVAQPPEDLLDFSLVFPLEAPTQFFRAAKRPPDLEIVLDEGRAVSALVMTEGGEVEVAAEDGLEILAKLLEGYMNALLCSYDRCIDEMNPLEVMNMMAYATEAQLLGAEDTPELELVDDCLRFELSFEAAFVQQFSSQSDLRNEATVRALDLQLFREDDIFSPLVTEGRLDYAHFLTDERNCAPGPEGSTFVVTSLDLGDALLEAMVHFPMNFIAPAERRGRRGQVDYCARIPNPELEALPVILILGLGAPVETVTWDCYGFEGEHYSSGTDGWFSRWSNYFQLMHADEFQGTFPSLFGEAKTKNFYKIEIPIVPPGTALYAEKVYGRQATLFFSPTREDTFIRIVHTPR